MKSTTLITLPLLTLSLLYFPVAASGEEKDAVIATSPSSTTDAQNEQPTPGAGLTISPDGLKVMLSKVVNIRFGMKELILGDRGLETPNSTNLDLSALLHIECKF
jgi:hypothetical protein